MKNDNPRSCISHICRFPRTVKANPLITPRKIFQDSRWSKHFRRIKQEHIEQELENEPALIEDWVRWTEDKRWTPAWGIRQPADGSWEVFLYTTTGMNYQLFFENPITACALLVRFEMEDLRLR